MRDLIKVLVLLGIISSFGCGPKITFPLLSEKIYAKNGGINDKSTFKLSSYEKDARMKAFLKDSTSFLRGKIHTLYLLEGYNIETATFYGTIWDKKNSISYDYYKGNLSLQKQSVFTNYQITLITHWDTTTIRKEEKSNVNWLDNNLQINGLRCYKLDKDWHIDEIFFENFYDRKRDG
jgi:hypothetical protein